jgi:diguanylate cyclase (GGDEF)-like protein
LSGEGTAARIGGDEFAVILVDKGDHGRIQVDVQRVFDELTRPATINGRSVDLSVSLGVALFPQDAETHEDLVTRADLALYEAKSHGRATYRFYGGNLAMPTSSRALRHALIADNPTRTRIGGDRV